MKKTLRSMRPFVCFLTIISCLGLSSLLCFAQEVVPVFPIQTPADARTWGLSSLAEVMTSSDAIGQPLVYNSPTFKVPLPSNLSDFVKDRQAALVLGKALFWDMQVGSDGIQACATCHFQAGSDIRVKGQCSTQPNRVLEKRDGNIKGYYFSLADPDTSFENVFGRFWGSNFQLIGADFPLIITQDAFVRSGDSILPDVFAGNRNDVVGSMGVIPGTFGGITPGSPVDKIKAGSVPGTMRLVTARNAPPSINAVFNYLQFWDGRADSWFNGFNPIGRHDTTNPRYYVNLKGNLTSRSLNMQLASLASQATGPPLSADEMSFKGRVWPDIGMKLLRFGPNGPLQPLAYQQIDASDSILGSYRHATGYGLAVSYVDLVKAAFKDELWNNTSWWIKLPSGTVVGEDYYKQGGYYYVSPNPSMPNAYSQMEANFSLFWGIAVMLYEAELVSHKSKFDLWMEGTEVLTPLELDGLNVFVNQGHCIACHSGAEFTNASVRNTQSGQNQIEPMKRADGLAVFYDNGFYNVAAEPTIDDLQRGGKDGNGFPLSSSRQFIFKLKGIQNIPFSIDGLPIRNLKPGRVNGKSALFKVDGGLDLLVCYDKDADGMCGLADEIVIQAVTQDGSCKASTVRNVELNGPYFHNGGVATLQQLLDNYDMGGKFRKNPLNKVDLFPDIRRLNLANVPTPNGNNAEKALIAFLLTLTDPRVKKEQAPFDHPELYIPINGNLPMLDTANISTFLATNVQRRWLKKLPAVGSGGGLDLVPFLGLSPYQQDTGKGVPIESTSP